MPTWGSYLDSLLDVSKDAPEELRAWWNQHGEAFCDALGCWPFEREWMLAMLMQVKKYAVGEFPGYKDAIDRRRCEVLVKAMRGEDVDRDELRMGLALMFQAYNAACERIRNLEQQQRAKPLQPPRPHPRPGLGPHLPRQIIPRGRA